MPKPEWRPAPSRRLGGACLLCALITALAATDVAADRTRLERAMQQQRLHLLPLQPHYDDDAGIRLHLQAAVLPQYQIYLVPEDADGADPATEDYIWVDAGGAVVRDGKNIGQVTAAIDLVFSQVSCSLFADGKPIASALRSWRAYCCTDQLALPANTSVRLPRVTLYDGFMRNQLEAEGEWRAESGAWTLRQRGGGMPTTAEEAKNAGFQRAVNRFSVLGSGRGSLVYGDARWSDIHAEARFYFGVPRAGKITDLTTVPASDMLLALGDPQGLQVSFGWQAAEHAFGLNWRQDGGEWRRGPRWRQSRPPISNWVKLSLAVHHGHLATGYLDGVAVVEQTLPGLLEGPLRILCGEAPIEFDDVRVSSLPLPAPPGAPLHVRSRNFSDKKRKDGSDPDQFLEWAKGANTFVPLPAAGNLGAAVVTRLPLFADFRYESVPYDAHQGDLPTGDYWFAVYPRPVGDWFAAGVDRPLCELRVRRDDDGWAPVAVPGEIWPADHRQFTLRLTALAGDLSLSIGADLRHLGKLPAGGVHLAISRLDSPEQPQPEHHRILAQNLMQELFEEAPADWSWLDGNFRMDARWACQDLWNFMTCGSTAVPYMTSKAVFSGDQELDCYMSLRPLFPWDAGDDGFAYDPATDAGWAIFREHHGWYNRHDLNLSFCSDGRNPLSGYTLIYAGYDNTETLLLRRGEVVAATRAQLISRSPEHGVIHWLWWHFHVSCRAGRIRISLNDEPLLAYDDPEPLAGGHLGFWSVRNGFSVARASAAAAAVSREPHALYVPGAPLPATGWQPLRRDTVQIQEQSGPWQTRVTFNSGSGFQAVRWVPAAPVALTAQPILELPLRLSDSRTRVNVHLDLDGRGYLIPISAPTTTCQALLTSEFEQGEQFQLPLLPVTEGDRLLTTGVWHEGRLRIDLLQAIASQHPGQTPMLLSITVGNTSNEGYLLAGGGGNTAGLAYELGTPVFRPR